MTTIHQTTKQPLILLDQCIIEIALRFLKIQINFLKKYLEIIKGDYLSLVKTESFSFLPIIRIF